MAGRARGEAREAAAASLEATEGPTAAEEERCPLQERLRLLNKLCSKFGVGSGEPGAQPSSSADREAVVSVLGGWLAAEEDVFKLQIENATLRVRLNSLEKTQRTAGARESRVGTPQQRESSSNRQSNRDRERSPDLSTLWQERMARIVENCQNTVEDPARRRVTLGDQEELCKRFHRLHTGVEAELKKRTHALKGGAGGRSSSPLMQARGRASCDELPEWRTSSSRGQSCDTGCNSVRTALTAAVAASIALQASQASSGCVTAPAAQQQPQLGGLVQGLLSKESARLSTSSGCPSSAMGLQGNRASGELTAQSTVTTPATTAASFPALCSPPRSFLRTVTPSSSWRPTRLTYSSVTLSPGRVAHPAQPQPQPVNSNLGAALPPQGVNSCPPGACCGGGGAALGPQVTVATHSAGAPSSKLQRRSIGNVPTSCTMVPVRATASALF